MTYSCPPKAHEVENSKFQLYINEYKRLSIVNWHINDACNFNCVYCYQPKITNNISKLNYSTIEDCFNKTRRTWIIHMSGGEPFLYPGFIQLCQALTRHHYITINTNLSTSNIYKFADTIDRSRCLFLNADVHILERERFKDGLNDYIHKFLYLQKKGIKVIALYVTYPPLFHRIEKDFSFLKSLGVLNFKPQVFRGVYKGKSYPKSYSNEEKRIIRSLGIDCDELAILENSRNYFGRLCMAGNKSFSMDTKGNLYRCSQSHKKYGNLFRKEFFLDPRPRPCPFRICWCPFEGIINAIPEKAKYHRILVELLNEIIYKFVNRFVKCFTDPSYVIKKISIYIKQNF